MDVLKVRNAFLASVLLVALFVPVPHVASTGAPVASPAVDVAAPLALLDLAGPVAGLPHANAVQRALSAVALAGAKPEGLLDALATLRGTANPEAIALAHEALDMLQLPPDRWDELVVDHDPTTHRLAERHVAAARGFQRFTDDPDDRVRLVLYALDAVPAPAPQHPLPPLPAFDDASDAVRAVLAYHGTTVDAQTDAAIAALDQLPDEHRSYIARLVALHLFQAEATRLAFADHDASGRFDEGLLLAVRRVLAEAILSVPVPEPLRFGASLVNACGGILLELVGTDDTYTCDYPLQLDLGGNDVYTNRAGASTPTERAALLVDRGGHDTYTGSIQTGSTWQGSGFHLDGGGDDSYRPLDGAATSADCLLAGAAVVGVGFHYDDDGDDERTFDCTIGGGAGSAATGHGAAFDLDGHDRYAARRTSGGEAFGRGHGGVWGTGSSLLIDASGNDEYIAEMTAHGGVFASGWALHVDGGGRDVYDTDCTTPCAVNGAFLGPVGQDNRGSGGSGNLYELGGSDLYTHTALAASASHGSAARTLMRFSLDVDNNGSPDFGGPADHHIGAGVLVDLGGDDAYIAACCGSATIGSGDGAAGVLLDTEGTDSYNATGAHVAAIGSAGEGGHGYFLDATGNDLYTTDGAIASQGSAYAVATATFVDVTGDDTYLVTGSAAAAIGSVWGQGIALFLDTAGDDDYTAACSSYGAVLGGAIWSGGLTRLFDLGGNDARSASCNGELAASGAAVRGGTALLVDADGDDTYWASAGSGAIHGASAGGLALLLDGGGSDTYTTSIGTGAVAGAAVGASLDLSGIAAYDGELAGLLFDLAGNDVFDTTITASGAAHGASSGGLGVLFSAGVANAFVVTGPETALDPDDPAPLILSHGAAGGVVAVQTLLDPLIGNLTQDPDGGLARAGGMGLLVGSAGDDLYVSPGLTMGAGILYGTGILLDPGGANSFSARGPGLAQGLGWGGGQGIVVDAGTLSVFSLDTGGRGQGTGIGGAGILVRTDPQSRSAYGVSRPTAERMYAGSLSMRLDAGTLKDGETLWPLGCPGSEQAPSGAAVMVSQDLCILAEDPETMIRDPRSADVVAPQHAPGLFVETVGFRTALPHPVDQGDGRRAAVYVLLPPLPTEP